MSTYHTHQTARIPRVGEAGPSTWDTQPIGEMSGRPARELRSPRQADLPCTQSEEDDDDDLVLAQEELTGITTCLDQKKPRQNSFDFVIAAFRAQEERAAAAATPSASSSSPPPPNMFEQAAASQLDDQPSVGAEAAGSWVTMPRLSALLPRRLPADYGAGEGAEDAREMEMEEIELQLYPNAAGTEKSPCRDDVEALRPRKSEQGT